jgi:xanthine dehydrogenase accessory factor
MLIHEKILELQRNNKSFCLATVIQTKGSAPGKVGFKMITTADEKTIGTVGGGAIEMEIKKESLLRIASGESGTKEYLLSSDPKLLKKVTNAVPMSCNGTITIFYEVFGKLPVVYLFGGGHVGQAVQHFLKPLGYYIILVDNRNEILTQQENSLANEKILSDYSTFIKNNNFPDDAYFVILTHGHKFDYEIIKGLFKKKVKSNYFGIIASKNKAHEMKEKLHKDFGNKLDFSNLYTPIGLKIGGNSAAEIALSIAAEIQSIRYLNSP